MFLVPRPVQLAPQVQREQVAQRPISWVAARKSPQELSALPLSPDLVQLLAGLELLARISLRIAPSELITAASGKATVTNDATKCGINMTTTTLAISGRTTPVGLPGQSPAPSHGLIGVR